MKWLYGVLATGLLLAGLGCPPAAADLEFTGDETVSELTPEEKERRDAEKQEASQAQNDARFVYVRIIAGIACLALLAMIVELVRRRKLRIEYSWLWILTGLAMLVLALWYELLIQITRLIFLKGPGEAVEPRETLYLFGFMFLLCICLHYSVKISQLTDQVKLLAQELSLHKSGVEEKDEPRKPQPKEKTGV